MPEPENPYAPPRERSERAPGQVDRDKVKSKLWRPACFMMLAGSGMAILITMNAASIAIMSLFLPDFFRPFFRFFEQAPWLVAGIISIGLGSVLCVVGGLQMLRLRGYSVCVLGAIAMTLPVTSPGLWLGWIIGIWTLTILLQKDTRAAFAEENR